MVLIPTTKDEDAKRPNRERQSLVGEQTRIVNRMKAALIRLGIRGFNPKLKKAAGHLEDLRTPEDEPIPPNTLAELRRDMERRRLLCQISQIEEARLESVWSRHLVMDHTRWSDCSPALLASVSKRRTCWHEILSRRLRDRRAVARYAGLTGAPDESGKQTTRERARQGGKRTSTSRNDLVGLALFALPERTGIGTVVSGHELKALARNARQ